MNQVIEMTDEEKMAMYMKMPQEEVVKMLIELEKHIKPITYEVKTGINPVPPFTTISSTANYLLH